MSRHRNTPTPAESGGFAALVRRRFREFHATTTRDP
jgi:hypothetical protein